jgi:hypothetical protein
MAENIRDVLRAAQAAELGGDKARAIELLRRAASLCGRSGNLARAEQLLRYALRLDPSRADVEKELGQLLAGKQVEARPVFSAPDPDDDDPTGDTWVLREESTSLAEALREAELAVDRRINPVGVAAEVVRAAALSGEMPGERTPEPVKPPAPEVPAEARREEPPSSPPPEAEAAFIERGPTRADPALDAWCSFCCRPRTEVGALVAGPAGAFICAACIGESGALLGGVAAATAPARRQAPAARAPVTFELVGQEAARDTLERGLAAGVRQVLLLGPEGCGKSTWVRALAEQGRGVLVTADSLDRAPVDTLLLVEDVDRLPPTEQAALGAFLARHPACAVVMTARGNPVAPGLVLLSDSGRLALPTTAALSEAVRDSLPVALLERVRLLVSLERPGVEEWIQIARLRLASREDRHLSDEVLTALATEAARSPRAGHELQALLDRVPPGTWRLESKKVRAKPARRSRRKGKS